MNNDSSRQNIRYTWRYIWLIVLFLIISILLTLALLSPLLSSLTHNDRDIIPLVYNGNREIVEKDGLSYIRIEKEPYMTTEDNKVQWESETAIDLFKMAYVDDKGEIKAQTTNDDKIIAPGTSNDYEFTIKNTGNISLDYELQLNSIFTLADYNIPIEIRLKNGDRWILGDEKKWVASAQLEALVDKGSVEANKNVIYTLEWRWPYASGDEYEQIINDFNDTVMGNRSLTEDVHFELTIQTQAIETPKAVPVDGNGQELVNPLDLWNFILRFALPILIGAFFLLLLLLLRRPIYVTGFAPGAVGEEFKLDKKKTNLLNSGRFVFKKVYNRKHRFILGDKELKIKLKYKAGLDGISFEIKDDRLIITVGRKVRAIELYLLLNEAGIFVNQGDWAAIDKKRNVITPNGVIEPKDKENTTPGGLHINKNGYFEV